MKTLLKYSGIILQIIGVAILLIPKITHSATNTTLLIGGIFIALGIIAFIITNKYIKA